MIGKRRLIAFGMLVALTVFGVLNLDTIRVSAVENPTIYISPSYVSTGGAYPAVGANYTFSVCTDYDGSDVYGYEFSLTFNPLVLQVVEVVNGDLITGAPIDLLWDDGDLNNPEGTLTLVRNGYYYVTPPPTLVSGPGILANVKFTVVAYGNSPIAFVESETRLIGWRQEEGEWEPYSIIDRYFPIMHRIKGGFFYNSILGDGDGSGKVNYEDLFALADAYGSHGPNYNYAGEDPSSNWDQRFDFGDNNRIDYNDLFDLADHYGEHYP
jgi:hypothetical protein